LLLLLRLGVELDADAVHVVCLEGADVRSSVRVLESSDSILHALSEVAVVNCAISGVELAFTFELTHVELTFVGLFFVSDILDSTSMEL